LSRKILRILYSSDVSSVEDIPVYGIPDAGVNEYNGWKADFQNEPEVDSFFEKGYLAQVARDVKDRREAQDGMEVEIEVSDGHKENRGTKASYGADDFGKKRQKEKDVIDLVQNPRYTLKVVYFIH